MGDQRVTGKASRRLITQRSPVIVQTPLARANEYLRASLPVNSVEIVSV